MEISSTRKRLIGILVALFMVLALVPTVALATDYTVANYAQLVAAIASAAPGDTIKLTQDITLINNEVIEFHGKSLTITSQNASAPATIKRSSTAKDKVMLTIDQSSDIILRDLIIDGGAIWTGSGETSTNSGIVANESAIHCINSTLTIGAGGVVRNNEVNARNCGVRVFGGGIYAEISHINIDGGKVEYNCANGTAGQGGSLTAGSFARGGGIYIDDYDHNDVSIPATATSELNIINGGSVSNNWAKNPAAQNSYGGNVAAWHYDGHDTKVTVNGGKVDNGFARQGGGIYLDGADFEMTDGEINGNKATVGGGGVYIKKATNLAIYPSFVMSGGTISNNIADSTGLNDNAYGGGVYIIDVQPSSITGGSITGNSTNSQVNRADGAGGIAVFQQYYSTQLTIGGDASVTGNSVAGSAGGIWVSRSVVILEGNSTVSGNTAADGYSDAIKNNGTLVIGSSGTSVSGKIYLQANRVVTLASDITNSFELTTSVGTDDADGRVVVVPGSPLTDTSPYVGNFSHNTKGIITATPNLILGGLGVRFNLGANGAATTPADAALLIQHVVSGGFATAPAVTANNGYRFAGWTLDGGAATVLDSATINATAVTQNVSYTASYVPVYTVTYHSNYATGTQSTYVDTYDAGATPAVESITASYIGWTQANYTFSGWNTAADGSGTTYGTASTLSALTANVDLYAIWTPVTYTITYALDGGTNLPTNPTSYTVASTVSIGAPTKANYTFTGWTSTTTVPAITNDVTFTGWAAGTNTGNQTLAANWSADQYTITYVLDGGTNAATNPSTYDTTSAVTIAAPTKTGYTFAGWTSTTTVPTITNDSGFTGWAAGANTGNQVLTANWSTDQYTITYVLNGGTNAAGNPGTYNTTSAVTINAPTKAGYTFDGWTSTTLVPAITNDVTFTGWAAGANTGNQVLTANWKNDQLSVTWIVGTDGTTTDPTTQSVNYGATPTNVVNVTVVNPTYIEMDGWDFVMTMSDGTVVRGNTADPTTIVIRGTTVFTAHYKAIGTPVVPPTPPTGDNSNTGLWIALMALSIMGAIGCGIIGDKKKKRKAE